MLDLRDVTIRRGDHRLFAPLTCRIVPGRPLTVMGPSGAGKSSLLAWLTGVLPPGLSGEGEALLDGVSVLNLPAHQRRLGILFQDDLLFPHMTVGENLAFGLPHSQSRQTRRIPRAPQSQNLVSHSRENRASQPKLAFLPSLSLPFRKLCRQEPGPFLLLLVRRGRRRSRDLKPDRVRKSTSLV